jgi:RNA polymerase sigma-70 factor (ECF subfamily)
MPQVNSDLHYNLSDKQLIDKVLGGEPRAFAAIVKRTEALVAQIVFKMIGRAEDRKDLAQDVYLKAYNNLSRFRYQSKLSTWIATIAYNTCLSHLEKKQLILLEEPHSNINIPETDPLPILEKERIALLQTEIGNLSPIYRTLITLYHQQELSYDEIGQITGLPSGTVKSYLFRARQTLKNNLLSKFKKEEL